MYIDEWMILEAKKELNNYCDDENNKIETHTEFLELEYDDIKNFIKNENTVLSKNYEEWTVKVQITSDDKIIYDGFNTKNMIEDTQVYLHDTNNYENNKSS